MTAEQSEPLLDQARRGAPEEVCGLLLGYKRDGVARVTRTIVCENKGASGTRESRFEIDPARFHQVDASLRDSREEIIGFYHSHPAGDPVPSRVDTEYMAFWPDEVWVIVAPEAERNGVPIRAWRAGGREGAAPTEVRVLETH